MLRLAGAALLAMAVSTPAYASDWYFVAAAKDQSIVSFVDKDSISDIGGGKMRASMFSLFADPKDDAEAYRFEIEIDCNGRRSRLVGYEIFDSAHQMTGKNSLDNEWQGIEAGSPGETVAAFICGKGKLGPDNEAAGAELPFDKARAMIDARAKRNAK